MLLLLLRGARLLVARHIARLIITFSLLHLASGGAIRPGRTVAAVIGTVVLLMRRRGCSVMVAEHHRRFDVARARAGRTQRVLMMHERAHHRRVRDRRRLVLAGGTAAQSG